MVGRLVRLFHTYTPNHTQAQMNNGGGERAEQQFNLMLQRVLAQDVQVMDPELLEKVTNRQGKEGGGVEVSQ